MSSHHFVKEHQEPAIILHKLDDFPYSKLGDLLEWAPKVICLVEAIDLALIYGFKIDGIAGKSSEISAYTNRQDHLEMLAIEGPIWNGLMQKLLSLNAQGAYLITSEDDVPNLLGQIMPLADKLDLQVLTPQKRHVLSRNLSWKKWVTGSGRYTIRSLEDNSKLSATVLGQHKFKNSRSSTLNIAYQGEGFIEINSSVCPFLISDHL
jgi:thiamine pyrophosphokinase